MDNSEIKILTVEDETIVRNNITAYLEDSGFIVFQAENGLKGWEMFNEHSPDLVLLDLRMPVMTGLEVLQKIKHASPETPVIVVSGTGTVKDAIAALQAGAWDFITKPIQEMEVLEHAIMKALERSALLRENQMYSRNLEDLIGKRTSELRLRTTELEKLNELYKNEIRERIFAEDKMVKSFSVLEKTIEGIIQAITYMGELRDSYTSGHQQRVAMLSKEIARELDLPSDQVRGVYVSAMLHDIGKIAVPIEILCKPGKLTDLDMSYMRLHPRLGYEILQKIEFPWPVAQQVLQHHERIDGSGYPDGVDGRYILLEARIISVADVVESMASHRPYRGSLGIERALFEVESNSGILYDEKVVRACSRLFREKGFTYD
jgi:putative nucleotidyltransferase with HDIG domain